jgi:hypothetical protein
LRYRKVLVFKEGIRRRDSRKKGYIQGRFLRKKGIQGRQVFKEERYSSK